MRINNRSLFKPRAKGNYRVENKTDKEATIYIYDEIGWFGVEAIDFVKDLNDIKAGTIHIRINSPGGNVFDGTSIFNAIKQHKSKTITHIDGLAASISAVIALAPDKILMAENAFMMIHNPYSMVIGNADDMRSEANLLEKVGGMISKTFIDKTGMDKEKIKDLMTADNGLGTWITADEAMELGFIDEIEEPSENENAKANIFDLSVFANVPDALQNTKKDFTKRDLENALRDVGCSQSQAKEILAKGFVVEDSQRDVDDNQPNQNDRDDQNDNDNHQRDVDPAEKIAKGSTEDLLMQAEIMAPTN